MPCNILRPVAEQYCVHIETDPKSIRQPMKLTKVLLLVNGILRLLIHLEEMVLEWILNAQIAHLFAHCILDLSFMLLLSGKI